MQAMYMYLSDAKLNKQENFHNLISEYDCSLCNAASKSQSTTENGRSYLEMVQQLVTVANHIFFKKNKSMWT